MTASSPLPSGSSSSLRSLLSCLPSDAVSVGAVPSVSSPLTASARACPWAEGAEGGRACGLLPGPQPAPDGWNLGLRSLLLSSLASPAVPAPPCVSAPIPSHSCLCPGLFHNCFLSSFFLHAPDCIFRQQDRPAPHCRACPSVLSSCL